MHRLRQAYRALFFAEGRLADRIEAVATAFTGDPLVEKVIAFIRAGGQRPLMRPRVKRPGDENGDDAS
jgi:UDP-N-acetylglucosamine acyltransferase